MSLQPPRIELSFSGLSPSWIQARHLRRACWHSLHLAIDDEALLERIEMIVEELSENLVKYSDWSHGLRPALMVRLDGASHQLSLITRNVAAKDGPHLERALGVAEQLSMLPPAVAFKNRIEEAFGEEGLDESRLGLLRIAFEGEADLQVKRESDDVLIVRATLSLLE